MSVAVYNSLCYIYAMRFADIETIILKREFAPQLDKDHVNVTCWLADDAGNMNIFHDWSEKELLDHLERKARHLDKYLAKGDYKDAFITEIVVIELGGAEHSRKIHHPNKEAELKGTKVFHY